MPRNTEVFEPTFKGTGIVRSADITTDPRYGHNAPYHGMPPGHLPVRSYLAVPVRGRAGDVIGGLFFGHSEVGRFSEQHERLAVGIASWASVALENARLYMNVQEASRLKDEFLGQPVPRAADAAQRDPGLRADAADRNHRAGQATEGHRHDRAQRHVAHPDRRGRARHLAHRVRQDPTERPAGRLPGHRPIGNRRGRAGGRGQRGPDRDRARSTRQHRSPAIRNDCSRCCGTCCRTP